MKSKPIMGKDIESELKEKLAAIEHERWSDWQKWMHQLGVWHTIHVPNYGNREYLCYSKSTIDRWNLQIDTPYDLLTPDEQKSDMEQVDRYWPLIEELLQDAQRRAVEDIVKIGRERFENDEQYMFWAWLEDVETYLKQHPKDDKQDGMEVEG